MIWTVRAAAWVLLASAVAGSAGCASYSVTSSAKKEPIRQPAAADVKFRIAEVVIVAPTNMPVSIVFTGPTNTHVSIPPAEAAWADPALLRGKLSEAARERYPWLFANAADAVPVRVSLRRVKRDSNAGADACLSCLTLTIIPMRSWDETLYRVDVAPLSEKTIVGLSPSEFRIDEMSWMSIVPTGWIPVPDRHGERAWTQDGAEKNAESVMIRSCVDTIAWILLNTYPGSR
ncbi:MAG: hypothetical protein FJ224_10435 [Lentisphaerae bacterium]|nr:hypothetical protein [Lentisphaerota bacterium]